MELEEGIRNLRTRLDAEDVSGTERDHVLRQMQLSAIALDSYERAYELEQKLKKG